MYLLDTNIISEFRKQQKMHPNVNRWLSNIDLAETFISVITVAEIKTGYLLLQRKDPRQANILQHWFISWVLPNYQSRVLPITTEIALTYAELYIPDKKVAHDALIASTAIHHNLTLVTRNIKDMQNIPVKLLNPFD